MAQLVDTVLEIERNEAKYHVPEERVPAIREFIRWFCVPDRHGVGEIPEYTITTLQLDTPSMALHRAKALESSDRFKLRVRTYGEPGSSPVFLEIKRKHQRHVFKSRAPLRHEDWGPHLIYDPVVNVRFQTASQELAFYEFRRLSRALGATPRMLLRYRRESYIGRDDHYARVTFDRRLEHQPTRDWAGFGVGGRWHATDVATLQGDPAGRSSVILELKALRDMPLWMMEVVREFDLRQCGNCKYSNAVHREDWFLGETDFSPLDPDRAWF